MAVEVRDSQRTPYVGGCKKCCSCGYTKNIGLFYVRQSGPRKGLPSSQCKECSSSYAKEWYRRHGTRERNWERKLRNGRGITKQEYESILSRQGGGCGICGTKKPVGRTYKRGRISKFSVDHCHSTGAVRGLLCMQCNMALGQLGDSLNNLQSAMEYLRKYGSKWQ